jgi:hypothetical protein
MEPRFQGAAQETKCASDVMRPLSPDQSGGNQGAAAGWLSLKIGRQLIRRNALWTMTKAEQRVQE